MGLLAIVFMALDFVTVTITTGGVFYSSGSASGYAVAGAGWTFQATTIPAERALYVIPLGGVFGILWGLRPTLFPSQMRYVRIFGILVLVGGLLELLGGVMFYLSAGIGSAVVLGFNVVTSAGIGLWGVLISGVLQILFGILMILKK
jgi:uncharacterized membrane protein